GDPVGSPGSGSSLIATIQQCCSTAPEYNNPSLPIMEVIFRVFLASGNKPMTLEEIHEQFRIWVGPSDGRALNEDVLKKLVGADLSYGIHPYVGETEAA
ncbi:MAG: hypothetical protein HW403_698, partial [Dehalococcoidia bacterium]|nr:hypothetical protein [Dehalococcoidia bacterium]